MKVFFCIIGVIVCVSCATPTADNQEVSPAPETTNSQETGDVAGDPVSIMAIIDGFSSDELIGQMVMPALIDENGRWITQLTDSTAAWLRGFHLGGVIVYKQNIQTEAQIRKLTNDLQQNSDIPLIIAVDHEGGDINRFSNLPQSAITRLPSARQIGRSKDAAFVRDLAESTARELRSFGFTMNLAPVADILQKRTNAVIVPRSFGWDPEFVADMTTNYIIGLQSQQVSAAMKHFPGHGRTSVDSHRKLPIIIASRKTLENSDMLPFKRGIATGVDAIMIAHISYPRLGSGRTLAMTDPTIVTSILRNELGFSGIVMSDALSMKAVLGQDNYPEIIVQSILAGMDVLLKPQYVQKMFRIIQDAVRNGSITQERLKESVFRILQTKIKRGLMRIDDGKIQATWQPAQVDRAAVRNTHALVQDF